MTHNKLITGIAVAYMIGSTALAIRYFDLYRTYEAKVPKSEKEAQKEIDAILPELRKIMEVPDERPVIATVKDAATLKKSQQFFTKAENGDKLVVFSVARKAVLYRPSKHIIVESGPLLVNPQQGSSQQVKPIKVAVWSGNPKANAKEVEENLRKAGGAGIVTISGNTRVATYTKDIVVDLTGTNQNAATEIAKFVKAEVGTLPSAESKPDADILLIVGSTAK